MAQSLEEYAAQHPQQAPEREQQSAINSFLSYRDQLEERENVEILKQSILAQLEKGGYPEQILLTALEAIGRLTNDQEWTAAGVRILTTVYEDIAQQSLLRSFAVIETARLKQMQLDYNDRTRRQLTRSLNGYRKLEKALKDALQAIDETAPNDEP